MKSNLSDFTVISFGILSRRPLSPCGHCTSSLLLSPKHPSIPSLWWHFSFSVRAVSGHLVDRHCRRKGLCCRGSMVWGQRHLVLSHKHWLVSPWPLDPRFELQASAYFLTPLAHPLCAWPSGIEPVPWWLQTGLAHTNQQTSLTSSGLRHTFSIEA